MKINQFSIRSGGFTLIELMIVVAIIGILSAIAIPSYNSYMFDSRRADGTNFLTEVAGEQARFYSENNRFATTMAELGYGEDATAASDEGYYSISIAAGKGNQFYVLKAIPVTTGPQANDTKCAELTLSSSKQKTVSGTGATADCW